MHICVWKTPEHIHVYHRWLRLIRTGLWDKTLMTYHRYECVPNHDVCCVCQTQCDTLVMGMYQVSLFFSWTYDTQLYVSPTIHWICQVLPNLGFESVRCSDGIICWEGIGDTETTERIVDRRLEQTEGFLGITSRTHVLWR